jgi:FtsZ-binding cell division protein ZapB
VGTFVSWITGRTTQLALEGRVSRLEQLTKHARNIFNSLKQSNAVLLENNRLLSEQVTQLEADNRELKTAVQAWQEFNRKIDPNAKCPACGACRGHLQTIVAKGQVRCVNHCEECGFSFLSAEPIAGAQRAFELWQAPKDLLGP